MGRRFRCHGRVAARPVPVIRLLVTDLDNTLYDWAGAFVDPLYNLVAVVAPQLGVSEGRLLDELRHVHRHHRDVEHPGALWQTRSARACLWGEGGTRGRGSLAATRALVTALRAFEVEQAKRLTLYPSVERTLRELARRGVRVVALTDATLPNACSRVRHLRLDRYIHSLYAAAPRRATAVATGKLAAGGDVRMAVSALGSTMRKPDPKLLLAICREHGVVPRETLYVGDSLGRDMAMAQAAGVPHAWARYGAGLDTGLRRRLARVSHYTRVEAERERVARRICRHLRPQLTLHEVLDDILERFSFAPLEPRSGLAPARPVANAPLPRASLP